MRLLFFATALTGLIAPAALGGELLVNVIGISGASGEIGCALHQSAASFPTGNAGVSAQWQKAEAADLVCRFTNLSAGAYAVAVSHDLNGNRKTDTNFLGMPTEDWGVSNNVRPSLRAPTFEEARVEVPEAGETTIQVRLGR